MIVYRVIRALFEAFWLLGRLRQVEDQAMVGDWDQAQHALAAIPQDLMHKPAFQTLLMAVTEAERGQAAPDDVRKLQDALPYATAAVWRYVAP